MQGSLKERKADARQQHELRKPRRDSRPHSDLGGPSLEGTLPRKPPREVGKTSPVTRAGHHRGLSMNTDGLGWPCIPRTPELCPWQVSGQGLAPSFHRIPKANLQVPAAGR